MAKHRKVATARHHTDYADTASWMRAGTKWVVCASSIAVGLGLAGLLGSGVAPATADASTVGFSGGFAERPGTTNNDDNDDPGVDVSDADTPGGQSHGPRLNVLRGANPARVTDHGPRVLVNGQQPGGTDTDDNEGPDTSGTGSNEGGTSDSFTGGQLPSFLDPDSGGAASTAEPAFVERIDKLRTRLQTVRKILGLAGVL